MVIAIHSFSRNLEIFCPMKKGNKSLPKIPDEFEMNIEMLSSGRKRGYNIRVSISNEVIRLASSHNMLILHYSKL